MGLSAYVHCNCFERGLLRSTPPLGVRPSVETDGSLVCNSDELAVQLAFDAWLYNAACPHENGRLLRQDLGNVSRVAALRARLEPQAQRFPLLLERVVYNGTHCGDHIEIELIPALTTELAELSSLDDGSLTSFQQSLQALCAAALQTGKPIVF